ncbi:MAG TPA: hypothetical protein VL463_11815 [Kofleriaceae bacterium]|nr:hypothetical protein [Kofleriaceae bacterium]
MPTIRVRLNPLFSLLFFGCSIFNFYVYGVTHAGMQAALGVMMGLAGVAYAFGTSFVVDSHGVMVKNPFGMTLKTHVYESPHDLEVRGNTLWVTTTDGQRKKAGGLIASGTDMRALASAIADARAKTPR